MIVEPACVERGCKHYLGVSKDEQPEVNERPTCAAFPNGIPENISYGDDLHLLPIKGDNGIQYEKK